MSPLLSRMHSAPGGVELLDVLMKYIYKGMGASASASGASRGMTAQSTGGFSQVGSRPTAGDGSGQAMSVLLSWHEKVSLVFSLTPAPPAAMEHSFPRLSGYITTC